jgi:arylsulfatase
MIFNLINDPFERADESMIPFQTYNQLYFIIPAQVAVKQWIESFEAFPPRQKSSSYNIDQILDKLMKAGKK